VKEENSDNTGKYIGEIHYQ